ncbi:hypothetical protein [Legionella bononiensis]|uniref:Uncharacterized protein n=1 Tax=Legionella bononiensis TaxID=2793102 RepID=A0ABS1W786_9GAMM|nr:hypothetical protein [Legionella bononiensis]MBL7481323.1 hypothetical protein [Legionella bononiensis]MBL7525227.1 hypothetical protein [Legionella bononiensis]MBL7561410.1 hypothetical protein [Legionella bononiensis]
MRIYCLLIGLFFSIELYGDTPKPCEAVGFDKLIKYITVSDGHMLFATADGERNMIKLFKKCIHTAAVCIVQVDMKSNNWKRRKNWINEQLIPPVDEDFDPVKGELVFGLLQYVDKKNNESVCIVAKNSFAHAIPWYGRSWVVTEQDIKDYEIYGSQFHIAMTPNSLYKALLQAHQEAVIQVKKDELEKEKKIEAAQKMLEEGSDPDFVSKLTGVPLESIRLIQRLGN